MPRLSHPLVGTWRLIACEHRLSDGRVTRPFGPKPRGRLIYTAEGRMIVMLMDPCRPPARSGQLFEAAEPELVLAARGFVAYSGRWRVLGGKVVHRVEMSLFPNWVGTSQVRAFSIRGRRVTFSTRAFCVRGVKQTARLVWERER